MEGKSIQLLSSSISSLWNDAHDDADADGDADGDEPEAGSEGTVD